MRQVAHSSLKCPSCLIIGSVDDLAGLQVVQHEPLRFPESPAVSPELKDLLQRMLCKVLTVYAAQGAMAALIEGWQRAALLAEQERPGAYTASAAQPACLNVCSLHNPVDFRVSSSPAAGQLLYSGALL